MKIKFKSLVAFSAFLVAGCAAFFSVFGLSQLFAGASLAVIIMASSLEFAKIISVSFLQRYWSRISRTLKIYLSIGVIVLVCITSAGIYGFLSNAYQKTATQYEIGENELSALSDKKALFQKNIDDNKAILATKSKRLDQLSTLRQNQENRLNQAQSNAERNSVRNDINSASKEIQTLNTEIDQLNVKINPFIDSVNAYENKIIESKSKNAGASEVGPLKYIATLVGQPMDKVVNWFILLLIFVFDPLAMALVIASNKLVGLETEEDESEDYQEPNMGNDDWMGFTKAKRIEPTYVTPESISTAVGLTNEESYQKMNEVKVDSETGEIDLKYNATPEEQDNILHTTTEGDVPNIETIESIPIVEEEVVEPIITEEVIEEIPVQEQPKVEPVVATGHVKLEDIKEIKAQNRGFSKEIPPPSHNTIQRIGSNKYTKNSEGDKVYFKKRKQ
jgi:flagellar biosynthesis chaperone FliJ